MMLALATLILLMPGATRAEDKKENKQAVPECFEGDGSDYRGYKAITVSGRTCQKWASQTPHKPHSCCTPDKVPELESHNYCRNPDGDDKPWCYTMDKNKRWEYCDIPYCSVEDIDDCAQNPCKHGACQDKLNDFTCTCDSGWKGKTCEQNIDDCAQDPCKNGACQDKLNDFTCVCDSGWKGKTCDQMTTPSKRPTITPEQLQSGPKSIDQKIAEANHRPIGSGLPNGFVMIDLDQVLTTDQYNKVYGNRHRRGGRDNYYWPNGVITYDIHSSVPHKTKKTVFDAMKDYEDKTCLRFVRANPGDYRMMIKSDCDGCFSHVGYLFEYFKKQQQNEQHLCLSSYCGDKDTALHELGHTIGLYHEHSRPDRDLYVTIKENNIIDGELNEFGIRKNVNSRGIPYDYTSIMHYGKNAHAKLVYNAMGIPTGEKTVTIVTEDPYYQDKIGTYQELSIDDVKLINLMYGCELVNDCYEGNGSGYRGRKTTTISGRKCQDWGSQSPHKHKYTPERFWYVDADLQSNYCRNPMMSSDDPDHEVRDPKPWCYTTDRNERFEYCGIPRCSDKCGNEELLKASYSGVPGASSEWRSDHNAALAFKPQTTEWAWSPKDNSLPADIWYHFDYTFTLAKISFTSRNGGAWDQTPKTFDIVGSNDCSNWNILKSVTNADFTSGGQTKLWTIPCKSQKPYECFGIRAFAPMDGSRWNLVSLTNIQMSEGMHVQCRLEDNVKYSAYNMLEDKVWNVQECQQNCIDQYPTCKGFTFKKNLGGCYLKTRMDGKKTVDNNDYSGVCEDYYNCGEYEYKLADPPLDFKVFNLGVSGPYIFRLKFDYKLTLAKISFAPKNNDHEEWKKAPKTFTIVGSHDCTAKSTWDTLREVTKAGGGQTKSWNIPCESQKLYQCYGIKSLAPMAILWEHYSPLKDIQMTTTTAPPPPTTTTTPPTTTTTTTTTATTTPAIVSENKPVAVAFVPNAFFIYKTMGKTWSEARQACQENGGDLASLAKNDDIEAIGPFVPEEEERQSKYWIGGKTMAGSHPSREEWFWLTGEPIPIIHEMHNIRGGDCAAYYKFKGPLKAGIYRDQCNEKRPGYICQFQSNLLPFI